MILLLSNFIAAIKGQARLWLGYALIAALVAMSGFTFAVWNKGERTEKDLFSVRDRLTTVEGDNRDQAATIDQLKELRGKDAKALNSVLTSMGKLAETDDTVRRRLSKLEETNETVRKYMSGDVPAELRCVLERTCPDTSTNPKADPS